MSDDTFSTASAGDEAGDTLTLEKLQKALDDLFPILYYALDSNVQPGHYFHVKAGDLNPEFLVIHPDDFEAVRVGLPGRRLVHIKNEPKEESWARIRIYWYLKAFNRWHVSGFTKSDPLYTTDVS
jgi:hypothetical protein